MSTEIDNEATTYESGENTSLPVETKKQDLTPPPFESKEKKKKGDWKKVAAGAGSGVIIGGVASFLMGGQKAEAAEPDTHKDGLSHPEWVDDEMKVATNVNDGMSFGEAFAAAREEVGPGGCFEWHGQIYGTYTAQEWNSMTPQEKAEFGSHFSWNHIDSSTGNVAGHASSANNASNGDVEVVSVSHTTSGNDEASNHVNRPADSDDVVVTDYDEPEVEVLGVYHDDATGTNLGALSIGGEEVVLIDVDGDMRFDYAAADLNRNGELDKGEVADIHSENITVDDLGGFTDPGADLYASDGAADYPDNPVYDC